MGYSSNKTRLDELRQGHVHKEGGVYCGGNTVVYCLVEYFTALGCVFDWCVACSRAALTDQHAPRRPSQTLRHQR